MWKRTSILLLTIATGATFAGTDGYLRYCDPLTLRFGAPPLSPPPVNELILGMDLEPTITEEMEPQEEMATNPVDPTGESFDDAPTNDLITGIIPETNETPDEPKPFSISAGPDFSELHFPDIPTPTLNQPETEAQTMNDLLLMFNRNKSNGRRDNKGRGDKGPVLGVPLQVPPAIFTPPQMPGPSPASKSTYIVE